MDEIAQIESRDVNEVLDPTIAILVPLLKKNRDAIKEVPLRTYQYGPTDRHQLDVYYPLKPHPSGKTPVLFFIYGGSFITGERNLSVKLGLVYANLGAFFARRGIMTVIPDYRLVPNAVYPQPVEDVRDAMSWIVANADEALTTPITPKASLQLDKLFILGHSAGAFHTGTLIFNTDVLALDADLRSRIAGAALFGGPYDLSAVRSGTERGKLYEQYFGSVEEAQSHDILALARGFPKAGIGKLPAIVMLKAENEPDFLDEASEELRKELGTVLGEAPGMIIATRHNHISVNWVLSIGEGEEWAYDLADWIWARVGKEVTKHA